MEAEDLKNSHVGSEFMFLDGTVAEFLGWNDDSTLLMFIYNTGTTFSLTYEEFNKESV